jgi:hypothetical protein
MFINNEAHSVQPIILADTIISCHKYLYLNNETMLLKNDG